MNRWLIGLCSLSLLSTVVMTAGTASAECRVNGSTPAYTAGQLKDLSCTTDGYLNVTIAGGTISSLGTATAAAPTLVEGSTTASFSFDLSGSARVNLTTLLAGEDQYNNLIMVSGGAVRLTQILGTGLVPSTATDATTTPQILMTGKKTFTGRVTCTGTCVQTQKIYGTWRSTADATKDDLVGTILLNASTSDQASFSTDLNYSYWYVVTSSTSGTTPLSGVFVQY